MIALVINKPVNLDDPQSGYALNRLLDTQSLEICVVHTGIYTKFSTATALDPDNRLIFQESLFWIADSIARNDFRGEVSRAVSEVKLAGMV